MRQQLIHALASRLGSTIDRETALALVAELFPDRTWLPERFGAVEFEGYSLQCELLVDVVDELHPLHDAHYTETEKYRAGIPMDPDYVGMKEAERAGRLIQFTARHKATGELVGNMRVKIYPSSHTQTLVCKEDTLFLAQEHRGGFLAVKLWKFVEDAVVNVVGVREVRFTSKTANRADKMAKYLKYEPVGTEFVKTFF